jgi:amino acid adenylation domain-containing protein
MHKSLASPNDVLANAGWELTISAQFEAMVVLYPDNVALSLDGQGMTYAQLNARANQMAALLRELGVGTQSLVGIHLDRTFDLIVGIFAILKAGGAYLPLDMVCPEDRLTFMMEDSGAKVLLTDSKLVSRFAGYKGTILALDKEGARIAKQSDVNVENSTEAQHLAYVIYTSGSTGKPKGCLITQENVIRLFTATDHWYRFGPEDAWTLFHSAAFDFSVWEIFGALLYGGRLVIVPYTVSRSTLEFRELLIKERVTVLNQTPSAFRQLVQADQTLPKGDIALKYVIFGGEALEFQSLRPWFARYGDKQPQLVNMYGITETTVHVTYRVVTLEDLEANSGSNIGVPIPDLQVYVVDENLKRVDVGVAGEMLVGGLGVARGYLNRPDLTEKRFIANHFEPNLSPRLYRSGDLARVLENGDLEYLGRIDLQVKIRGFRIELGEIESLLARHPDVKDCAVLARTDGGTEPRLVAYLVTRAGATPNVEELRKHVSEKTPEYMVPSAFVFMDVFPLTLNGKLDRAKLPAPSTERPRLATEFVAPETELEKTITSQWQEVLKQDAIGIDDDFVSLGANSLMFTTVRMRLEKQLKREIPGGVFLQNRTTRKLAAYLDRKPGTADVVEAPPLMTCLQPGRDKPPFFFAHGDWLYDGLYCQQITPRLDADQPFYALAPQGTLGRALSPSYEAGAAEYVKLIRSVQPKGPYYLGGYCNGAVSIFEVAQQLSRAGETVAALVLLDPPELDLLYWRRITALGKALHLPERRFHGVTLRTADMLELWRYQGTGPMLREVGAAAARLTSRVIRTAGNHQQRAESSPVLSLQDLTFHYYELMAAYEPKPIQGLKSAWVVLRKDDGHRPALQTEYWSRFIPKARVESIGGTHLELSNNIGEIADAIKTALKSGV